MKSKKWTIGFRIILVAVGIRSLPLFILPLSLSVGVNIGNATGIGVALLAIFYGLFFNRVNQMIRKCKEHRFLRWFVYLAEGVVIVVAGLVVVLTTLMFRAMNNEPKGQETLVVLGCKVRGEVPSLSLQERLDAALEYMLEHPDAYCVVSGGQGPGEDISEAECMYRYLTQNGIDQSRIYKEDKSTSTRENLELSLKVIQENHLSEEIAIVTSEYHQYRASLVAKDLGIQSTAICGKTAKWLFPTYYIRELYGILYQWVF